MNTETNLLDVCRSLWHKFVHACQACVAALARMTQLTYRRWYIVLPVWIAVFALLALYYNRPMHRKYDVEGIILLNGPSLEHVKQSYAELAKAQARSHTASPAQLLNFTNIEAGLVYAFETFDIIDVLNDGQPDYVDYKRKTPYHDTLYQHMQDRLCLRFRLRNEVNMLPGMERAILDHFNNDPSMQAAYQTYKAGLEREAQFNHQQIEKLDSLTSVFYFAQAEEALNFENNNKRIVMGNKKIHLFLDDIQRHMAYTRLVDEKLTRATAPVVFEHHLTASLRWIHRPINMGIIALLLGWFIGCGCALIVDQRKRIMTFLRADNE